MRRSVILPLLVVLLAMLGHPAAAQTPTRALTLDDLYDPAKRIDFSGGAPSGLTWISETQYLWRKATGPTTEWLVVDAASGTTTPLFSVASVRDRLTALPGIDATTAERVLTGRGLEMNTARTAAVVAIGGDLYYVPFASGAVVRLTASAEDEEEFTFSPDGRLVSFLRGNDLYVVGVDGARERRLTVDGGPQRYNGKLDWVYQEEIYGRDNYRAYWWSPDSSRLAFLQLDLSPVPEFTVVDHMPRRLTVETWDYPKPGDPNASARLGVASVAGGAPRWVDLDRYAPLQFLVVGVSWAPEGRQLVFQVQDREQTWLDVNVTAADGSGTPRTLLRESGKAWVNDTGAPTWLKDGSFLWLSERSGWKHLYHYKADGTLVRAVTSGEWDLRTLHGVDEAGGWVYFAGTERSYIAEDVYRVKLDGSGLQRLSATPGWHSPNFSRGFVHYLDTWSDLWTPPQVRVHRTDGTEVRLVHESRIADLASFTRSKPELLQVKTRDGFTMEAILIRPTTVAPGKKYPVMQFTYAGPYAPRVANRWGGTTFMYYQLLAQQGIGVWICDNRSASGKGVQSVWPIYKQMGVVELQDIEDGLSFLKKQPWVDGARLGIDGWSYGGFMTTYALTHSKSFAMGIGGGNVTDWRLYDSIYTERYMQMPQHNPEGYAKTSVIAAAGDLHGELLLIHGVIDDNVHMQNTLQLSHALQRAGKRFRLMLYERSRHGVTDPDLVRHMRQMMFDFTRETLLGPAAAASTATGSR